MPGRSRSFEVRRPLTAMGIVCLLMVGCTGDAGEAPVPSRSPNARAAACSTYREFQAFARNMAEAGLSDEEIAARLAGYHDELERSALAAHRANYATLGDAMFMILMLIEDMRDAVATFGVGSTQLRHAKHNLSVASEGVACER